jgi:hypothetical protein
MWKGQRDTQCRAQIVSLCPCARQNHFSGSIILITRMEWVFHGH